MSIEGLKFLTILVIVFYVFLGSVVWAGEKGEKIIPGFKIEYIRDVHGFKLYEISSKDKSLIFDFCGDKLVGLSNKNRLIILVDINTRKIIKSITVPKNVMFDNVFCSKSGNVLFLTYSPSVVGVSKLYIYDKSSGKFLELFSVKDDIDAIPESVYFNYGDDEFIITPDKEGLYEISGSKFYLIPYYKIYDKIKTEGYILYILPLHIYKKNNKIYMLSFCPKASGREQICQIDLHSYKVKVLYEPKDLSLSLLRYVDGVFYFFKGEDYYTETVSLYRLSLDKKPKLERLKKIKWFAEFAGIDKERVIYGTAEGKIVLLDKNKEILLYNIKPKFAYTFPMEDERCGYCFRVSPYGILFRTRINTVVFYKSLDK